LLFPATLAGLNCFDTAASTHEDRQRQSAYQAERVREQERRAAVSIDDWLRGLQQQVQVAELDEANAVRATQLLNKTNQMNLSTRRLTGSELRTWASDPQHKLWIFRVADKFGDAGLTGILSLALKEKPGSWTSCSVAGSSGGMSKRRCSIKPRRMRPIAACERCLLNTSRHRRTNRACAFSSDRASKTMTAACFAGN
jgi:FkbH-like protein